MAQAAHSEVVQQDLLSVRPRFWGVVPSWGIEKNVLSRLVTLILRIYINSLTELLQSIESIVEVDKRNRLTVQSIILILSYLRLMLTPLVFIFRYLFFIFYSHYWGIKIQNLTAILLCFFIPSQIFSDRLTFFFQGAKFKNFDRHRELQQCLNLSRGGAVAIDALCTLHLPAAADSQMVPESHKMYIHLKVGPIRYSSEAVAGPVYLVGWLLKFIGWAAISAGCPC